MTIFQTERLKVRDFRLEEASDLAQWAGTQEVAPMMASLTVPWSIDAVKTWMGAGFQNALGFRAAICLPDDQMIGFLGIGGVPVSCAYAINPVHQGRGYTVEAMSGLLAFCFENLNLQEVVADHFVDNPVSGVILTRLGFEFSHTGTGESLARPAPAPSLNYLLTKEMFEATE
ncbi:MAG: GNAT family N-acetyltransferase [Pseudoruegeria sp.]